VNPNKRALLLVGSAKKQNHSTSESLGTYLLEQLHDKGFETEKLFIHKSLKSDKSQEELLGSIRHADIVVIAFPLYVDSLPYLVIKTMELIERNRQLKKNISKKRLLCIVNCGFPEVNHNKTALAICSQFAKEVNFKWIGGLALGGGEAIKGKPLIKIKGMARNIIKSLDLTANAIYSDQLISQEAIDEMAKTITPNWLYVFIGTMIWKWQAIKNGVYMKLGARPYQDL